MCSSPSESDNRSNTSIIHLNTQRNIPCLGPRDLSRLSQSSSISYPDINFHNKVAYKYLSLRYTTSPLTLS
jgi:hypothetical protein